MKLDLRSLALARILLGFCVIADCLFRLENFQAHYTDFGVLPLDLLQRDYTPTGPCFQCMSASPGWSLFLFALLMFAAIGMSLGWKTRISVFVTWILSISLHYRNPLVIDGGDVLLRCYLFWMLFLPCARVWSYDSGFKKFSDLRHPTVKSWTFLTLPGQMFLLYFFSALLKSGSDWWPDGTASGYALSLDAFVLPFGRWLTAHPDMLRIMSRMVFITELWAPFLLLGSAFYRMLGVFILIGFHISLGLALDLAMFPWIAISCLIGILPTEFWTQLAGFFPKLLDLRKQLSSQRKYLRLSSDEYAFSWIAMPFFALAISWNVLSYRKEGMYEPFRKAMLYVHLDQYWGMFAPFPLKDSGWYEFGVKLWNGDYFYTFVDPRMQDEWSDEQQKPLHPNRYFVDQRWRKYLVNLWEKSNAKFRSGLAEYLCRKWNQDNEEPARKAVSVDMEFQLVVNKEYLQPPREPSSVDLGTYECPTVKFPSESDPP